MTVVTEPNDEVFARMVAYFWTEKRNPTRYTAWDAARCLRLMPEFYVTWVNYLAARQALDHLAEKYE